MHRAVVDVDAELGLFRVVQVDTVQDVGHMINPQAVVGQIEGGTLQGIGLAILEEIVVESGIIEEPSSFGPIGAKGVGEPPTVSSTAAVVAAIRDATGLELNRPPSAPNTSP